MVLERIQRILAKAGISSRREAEQIVLQGRVMVNGKVVDTLGFKADLSRDHIKVDGKRLTHFEPAVALLLNKPRGYLSTVEDPEGRPTVMDLLKNVRWRVYPVGRLDVDAEGLLVITNDGELANLLSHPRFSTSRTYLVKVKGVLTPEEMSRIEQGVTLDDGMSPAIKVTPVRRLQKNSVVKVTLHEGRNRVIKRTFEAIGHPVLRLKRIGFASLTLEGLRPGDYRSLTSEEIEHVRGLL